MSLSAAQDAPSKILLILILITVPISGMGVDIYTPSLPAMTQYFAVDKIWIQLSVTIYIVASGCFQTIFGTLSGIWGQYRVLMIGMVLVTMVGFLLPFAGNIYILLGLRFLQGALIGAPAAVTKNLLSIHYEGKTLRRYSNYLTMAWAVGPVIAPAIGGYLQYYFSWQGPFFFLAGYSLLTLVSLFCFFPKTDYPRKTLSESQIIKTYHSLLTNKTLLGIAVGQSFTYALMLIFSVIGPFIIQSILHYSVVTFGYVSLLMGIAWLLGNIINGFLVEKFSIAQILRASMVTLLSLALLMLILAIWWFNLEMIVIFTFALLFTGSIVYTNVFGESLSLFRQQANVANGLLASLVVAGSGIASVFAATLHPQSALGLGAINLVLVLLITGNYYLFLRRSMESQDAKVSELTSVLQE